MSHYYKQLLAAGADSLLDLRRAGEGFVVCLKVSLVFVWLVQTELT